MLKTTITPPPPPPPPIDPGPMVVPIGEGGHPTLTPGGSLGEALGGYEGSFFPTPPPPPPTMPQLAPIKAAKLPKPTPKHMAWPAKLATTVGILGGLAIGGVGGYVIIHNMSASAPLDSTNQTIPGANNGPPSENLPTGFPTNLPDGAYHIQVCVTGIPCVDGGDITLSNGDASTFASQVGQVGSGVCQRWGSGSCSAQYSGFDGNRFTETITGTDCSSSPCVTATVTLAVTKVG